jgi:glutamate synthase domain-containing protein 2/ferredoxin
MSQNRKLHPRHAPALKPTPPPYGVTRNSRCINCGICARACIYACHERSKDDPRVMADPKDECCRRCFACIVRCPRGALSIGCNEQFWSQGEAPFTPMLIKSIHEQAMAGRIPVSGAGYGGPFDGPGYDNLWTDMSEIVRPTRDGIHGREHISTTVYLGRFVPDLCGMEFDARGNLKTLIPPNREVPLPVLFGLLPFSPAGSTLTSLALAASRLTTYLTVRAEDDPERFLDHFNHLVVRLRADELSKRRGILEWASIVEFEPHRDAMESVARAKEVNPHLLAIINLPVRPGVEQEVLHLARAGAEMLHLSADWRGLGLEGATLLNALQSSHRLLVEGGLRDRITMLASGGIAAAEHVPKTIMLGADAVLVDVALLIALGCTVCRECREGRPCPAAIGGLDSRWAATRVINLMLSWRDQLLEVLGAMGLRDVRRLRGEIGRAIFADQALAAFAERLKQPSPPAPDAAAAFQAGEGPALLRQDARIAPHRFPTRIAAYRVVVDRGKCTSCGLCVATCPYGVHRRTEGKGLLDEPDNFRCIGPRCLAERWCCVHVCPWKALHVENEDGDEVLGDRRWTPALLRETWHQAQTGEPAARGEAAQKGASGGGFDVLELRAGPGATPWDGPVDLSLPLNRRPWGPRISIAIPVYGGGMSYGSVSLQVMLGRAKAAQHIGTFTSTGEGGYPDELIPYADHVITQIATGLFGVCEDTILRARVVELKYAQGAKPGLGGHLLAEKNTPEVAAMREAVPGTSLFSPFPFHSVYSVEDHKKHLDWVRTIHPEVLISVKVSTPADVDMVAVGSYYAGANIIHLDGAYGGTGAAPVIAKKNIAQPIEYAAAQTHDFLVSEGIRDEVVLMVSGGVRTPEDVLKAVALGADGVVIGTAELVAIDCVRCENCERDRGCPIGIATTDGELAPQLTPEFVCGRIVNLYRSWAAYLETRLRALGMRSIRELRGRRDLLVLGTRQEEGK